jgi:hypothetical protein
MVSASCGAFFTRASLIMAYRPPMGNHGCGGVDDAPSRPSSAGCGLSAIFAELLLMFRRSSARDTTGRGDALYWQRRLEPERLEAADRLTNACAR